jgi:Transglutaminase-like superfamily
MTSTPSSSAAMSPAWTPSGSEEALAPYRAQSAVTDPGEHADLFAALPGDLPGLGRIAGGLVVHYFADKWVLGHEVPAERLGEVDTRTVRAMLARLRALDEAPLTRARPPARRLVGCCRDYAVLLCAMARHRSIPARLRVGFADYFLPGSREDHAVAECWDAAAGRWRLIDAQLGAPHLAHYRIAFDPLDVPRDRFLVGGRAWRMCRQGQADPDIFGVDVPGAPRGWPFLRSRLLLDLAALSRQEMLQWDGWGKPELDTAAFVRLDEAARLTESDVAPAAVRDFLAGHSELAVPPVIRSFSPAVGAREVVLQPVSS